MKKVTKLLAAVFTIAALIGTTAAATVAGVEVSTLKTSVTTTDGSDPALSIGGVTPFNLGGFDLGLELALGVNGDDVLTDLNVTYDLTEFGPTTVFATGGLGLNWIDTDSIGLDARAGVGVSYALEENKAIFATYTLGYDFDASDNDTQFRAGISFKF